MSDRGLERGRGSGRTRRGAESEELGDKLGQEYLILIERLNKEVDRYRGIRSEGFQHRDLDGEYQRQDLKDFSIFEDLAFYA